MAPLAAAVGLVTALVVLGNMWFGTGQPAPVNPHAVFGDVAGDTSVTPEPATVHISGAVRHPGIVSVDVGSRVADVIAAAGGALRSADLDRLNLAATVRDAEHVHVPAIDETGAAPGVGEPAPAGVDLNAATAIELEALPGVGPVLASRIVAHRDDHGPFATVEDLLDVPGIGEAKLAQLRDAVRAP